MKHIGSKFHVWKRREIEKWSMGLLLEENGFLLHWNVIKWLHDESVIAEFM